MYTIMGNGDSVHYSEPHAAILGNKSQQICSICQSLYIFERLPLKRRNQPVLFWSFHFPLFINDLVALLTAYITDPNWLSTRHAYL